MATLTKKVKLDKTDTLRALLTDTTPSDVPIIFANDGFYINSQRVNMGETSLLDALIKEFYKSIIVPTEETLRFSQSSPYKYKIRKDDISLRALSLLHPRSQYNFVDFYSKYSSAITYLCSISPFSVRAPNKITNSFYTKDLDSSNKYKEITIDTLESELYRKHASSFFSYRGYDRIYKLFSAPLFIELEKKYSVMQFLDVSKCFDSIYTHTISWAVKNKDYVKSNIDMKNQFAQKFDYLMQRSNNNETNGIPIGAEVSRVFSEIIFQKNDLNIIKLLEESHGYKNGKEYTALRYVDDYFVFSMDKEISKIVSKTVSDSLSEINLYINKKKSIEYLRPFCTTKSNLVTNLNQVIKDFEKILFVKETNGSRVTFLSRKINNKHKFKHSLIDKVKSLCANTKSEYAEASPYLIGVLSRRLFQVIESYKQLPLCDPDFSETPLQTRDAISIILELMFFFYSVCPTVPASNKLAKSIIIIDKFLSSKLPNYIAFIRTQVMENINQLPLNKVDDDTRVGYVSLERLNIVLATSEFGKNFLIPYEYFDKLLEDVKILTYFDIVSLLYYFRNHPEYHHLKVKIENYIISKFEENFDLSKNSEIAHLYLDLMSCPYISNQFKYKHLEKFYLSRNPTINKTPQEISDSVSLLLNTYWFVKWENLDLIRLLERKELKQNY